jgi:hypothetical protein
MNSKELSQHIVHVPEGIDSKDWATTLVGLLFVHENKLESYCVKPELQDPILDIINKWKNPTLIIVNPGGVVVRADNIKLLKGIADSSKPLYPGTDSTEWWRAANYLYGKKAAALQRELVADFNQQVNEHFKVDYGMEIVIRTVFDSDYGTKMFYGKTIHHNILTSMEEKETEEHQEIEQRIVSATKSCLERIQIGATTPVVYGTDLWAVLPLTVFYSGFVVNFGRAGGFWNLLGENVKSVIK